MSRGGEQDRAGHRPASDEAMDRHAPLQAGLLVIICWVWIAVAAGGAGLGAAPAVGLALLAIPVAFGLTYAVRAISAAAARTMITGLSAAGDIKYQHSFSIQESLIARGRLDEAVESFRAHLREFPDDVPARYRLATLHLRERNDPAAAEEELLALRRRPLDRATELLVSNHLIDLYRSTGLRGRLMAELTRMMNDHRGTPMGDGAAKLLEEVRRDRDA